MAAEIIDGHDAYNNGDSATRWEPGQGGEEDEFDSAQNSAKLFERSRIKALAGEREAVQKKTFTKWVNSHLQRVGSRIEDLYVDLRDGKQLLKLLEVLSGEALPKPTRGKMRIHCLENVDKALTFLQECRVHLENLGAHDIVDGQSKLTLGLIWTIILRFQIQEIQVDDYDTAETRQAKDALLLWCQIKTAGYPNVNVRNFTTSWRDGLAFNALIHKHRPDIIQYDKLQKANPVGNLNNAFNVASDKLGIPKLLDSEDVNVETPDEKSIMTYVAAYYHYFSKTKAETVNAKRIAKLIGQAIDFDKTAEEYDRLTSNLLQWIERKVAELNERRFENSLHGVQLQLQDFASYRTAEKPPKFAEKGNLEVMLFTLQSQMRANYRQPYKPADGKLIADINKAWSVLERAEHERELALREELIRQEKLEQLATRFDRKAAMRETWLLENQRLVSHDNFGNDLPSVEAALKKQEAIETDIQAYEERVQAVVQVAEELEKENYHDIERVNGRKNNVLTLWRYLMELLMARRRRLNISHDLQNVFQEMSFTHDWIKELRDQLLSEEYGRHLVDVEDLIQKHNLREADVQVLGERVGVVNQKAQRFIDADFPEVQGYCPVEPDAVRGRVTALEAAYADLVALAAERRAKLQDSKKMWQFYDEIADEGNWIREKEQLLTSPDLGHDLTSVQHLINKHKTVEEDIDSHNLHFIGAVQVGGDLIKGGHFRTPEIQQRIVEVTEQWKKLVQLSALRKKRLLQVQDYYKFFSDAEDVDAWIVDHLRLVSSDDVGHDDSSVQALIRKHQDVADEISRYQAQVKKLHDQADALDEKDKQSREVVGRLAQIDDRYDRLLQAVKARRARLQDAQALYRLLGDADWLDSWVAEKEKFLGQLQMGTDSYEELEIIKHRFDSFEQELTATKPKLDEIEAVARRLLEAGHPDAQIIQQRCDQLRNRWNQLQTLIGRKRDEIGITYGLQSYQTEAKETITWIKGKTDLVQSTDALGNDLSSVMQLQRKLSGMERDMIAIERKVKSLEGEADRLAQVRPREAEAIRVQLRPIHETWAELKQELHLRDEKLSATKELQKFLQNLDHFQQWLQRTQTTIANEDVPTSLTEAEQLLQQHQQIKDEMDSYEPDYEQMMSFGQKLVQGNEGDVQYMFLRERLQALENSWKEMHQMWENRQDLLSQGLRLQIFLRDAKQAEVLLNQQENFLSREEIPGGVVAAISGQTSTDAIENMIKQHDAFLTTMEANDDKINAVIAFADELVAENHYDADRISRKANSISEKRQLNRQRGQEQMERLKDALHLQNFIQECDDLQDWVQEKIVVAQDETYRDAKNLHSKFLRHQAFEAEIKANKERLDNLKRIAAEMGDEKPEWHAQVDPRIQGLEKSWSELERTSREKGQRLFDSNRQQLYQQNCDDVENWLREIEKQMVTTEEITDLTTVNILLQKQQKFENELATKRYQVEDLKQQAQQLEAVIPDLDQEVRQLNEDRRAQVEERLRTVLSPMEERKALLDKAKRVHQFLRDVEDEMMWISERLPQATNPDVGTSLQTVLALSNKHQMLEREVENHEPRISNINNICEQLAEEGHPQAEDFQNRVHTLNDKWAELLRALADRRQRLHLSQVSHQYLHDADEAEAWMSEQELTMMSEERPRDESASNNAVRKHAATERAVDDFADTIRSLDERARGLVEGAHPDADRINAKRAQLQRAYAALKELARERRHKMDDILRLYMLSREIDDVEAWIAEREAVAGSHELGQDLEHVMLLQERFADFVRETESIGQEKVAGCNEICDRLISAGHNDAAAIAEWKDAINEAWTDLLELMDTRTQHLQVSYERHKFLQDCRDTLQRIQEKSAAVPNDVGKDAKSAQLFRRKHDAFVHEVHAIEAEVLSLQERAVALLAQYAADKADEVKSWEKQVVDAWNDLQTRLRQRQLQLMDADDLYRFFNVARDLMQWMEEITNQMTKSEKPRDVSGVELLMSNHQSLKAEIDSRDENFYIFNSLGKDLLDRLHTRSTEIREKLMQVAVQRGLMVEKWEERWEDFRILLEIYKWAREASLAEAWLIANEPYLQSTDVGDTLEAVEKLIRRHEAFEKSAAAQEPRFHTVSQLTQFEIREKQRRQEQEFLAQHPDATLPGSRRPGRQRFIEDFMMTPKSQSHQQQVTEQQKAATLQAQSPGAPFAVATPTPTPSERHPAAPGEPSQTQPPPQPSRTSAVRFEKAVGGRSPVAVQRPESSPQPAPPTPPTPTQRPGSLMSPTAAAPPPSSLASFGTKAARATMPASQIKKPAAATAAPVPVRPRSEDRPAEGYEGLLVRKHVWESAIKKASGRSWDKLYTVLSGSQLLFYKDQKHAKADPRTFAKGQTPLDLSAATVQRATDYTKRPHVIRLRLANGGEFLLQARDDDDATAWLNRLGTVCTTQPPTSSSATLPAQPSSSASKQQAAAGRQSPGGQAGTTKR